jgi:enoyl-CoA hydratase
MEFKNILYEKKDGILYLTLNRPEVRNALSPAMWSDIDTAIKEASIDDSVHVLIITGAGDKALASGADIQELHDRYYMEQMRGVATTTLKNLEDIYKPVICAINGYALGGGCELAEACDIRIATKRSKFGQPEVNLGIIPGAGGTQRLTRIVGVAKAKELIFTGCILSAEEAKSIGLVNQITEDSREALMEAAETMAKQILSKGPVSISMAKIAITLGRDSSMETGLMLERLAQTIALSTADRKEGTSAFLEKRPAKFQGR